MLVILRKSFPFRSARTNENLTAEQFFKSWRRRSSQQKAKTLFSAFARFIWIRKPAIKRIASIPRGPPRERPAVYSCCCRRRSRVERQNGIIKVVKKRLFVALCHVVMIRQKIIHTVVIMRGISLEKF